MQSGEPRPRDLSVRISVLADLSCSVTCCHCDGEMDENVKEKKEILT